MVEIPATTRAYTLKLSGDGNWRDSLWRTHCSVNQGVRVWGDWLLTLRGGLPASLAEGRPERRVLLALSWLSVESPLTLAPDARRLVTTGRESATVRSEQVMDRFRQILSRQPVENHDEWINACEPALTARIRDDACWIDRSLCFAELQQRQPGLSTEWAASTLFDFLGGADVYFHIPGAEETVDSEAKDFVKKAGGWLSRNWGSGEKSDACGIGTRLGQLAVAAPKLVGESGATALQLLLESSGEQGVTETEPEKLFKRLKQIVGWKGRPSKGAMALERLVEAEEVTEELAKVIQTKLQEEALDQSAKASTTGERPSWMSTCREELERRISMPYRTEKDLIWEHGVMLDHALRRVSSAHSWIKLAEAERKQFLEDAQKRSAVPGAAGAWLDSFREERSSVSGSLDEYIIRRRALDAWDKVVRAWSQLGDEATVEQRVQAARDVESNLDDNEKFGDIQLFEALAADEARCVWQDADGRPEPAILKNYSAATVAEHNRRRFKVPAYRHPDPLRHPVFVDFGNSRWGITYSALKTAHDRDKLTRKLATAKTDKARLKIQQQLAAVPDLRGVTLDLWTGQLVESVPLRWHGKRLWRDLDLQHFGETGANRVTRADRLGRSVAGKPGGAVSIAAVFGQKDWNGRLQVARQELDRLADLVYGKHREADPVRLAALDGSPELERARQQRERLGWFLTTSAKLQPQGPWLDYVACGLPFGIEYKRGRSGPFLNYTANKDRKGRARLLLARLPGLRVLSLDLGHRYAAACTVWETLTRDQMEAACRACGHPLPDADTLSLQLQRKTGKTQRRGRRKGEPVTETTIYRRIGPDVLPEGTPHPAPWARLDRQFLIKLPGEERHARPARPEEQQVYDQLRSTAMLKERDTHSGSNNDRHRRIDELQADAVRITQRGIRRLGNVARVAHIFTAATKPLSGGRTSEPLTNAQRVEYVLDTLLHWQELAQSQDYDDPWAKQQWSEWIDQRFGGPHLATLPEDCPRSERKKRLTASREPLRPVAEQLADAGSPVNKQLHQLWTDEWRRRSTAWQRQLRVLRRLILPRIGRRPSGNQPREFAAWKANVKALRQTGGLSLRRLKTIRDLYQVLKAFHMRPEPEDLRKNIPAAGDESLGRFGRRILDQLERLREQRIKQLASRIIEAALGVGSEDRQKHWNGWKRAGKRIEGPRFAPCHAVVVENLENYRPEETRLRRENRQLMNWAARNVRKYILEGCQLHGLHFVEVPPNYTSRQDSRTGAPGIRCEDFARAALEHAVQGTSSQAGVPPHLRRQVETLRRELTRCEQKQAAGDELNQRERLLQIACECLSDWPSSRTTIRLPRRGGELFVSAVENSPAARGLQADLNAAANIGLKALADADWMGAWWFVLVERATGCAVMEKLKGAVVWSGRADEAILEMAGPSDKQRSRQRSGEQSGVYAWNPLHWQPHGEPARLLWTGTANYWKSVEQAVVDHLERDLRRVEVPW